MNTVNIGPFAFSTTVFLIFMVLLLSFVFALLYERRYKVRLEATIWWVALSGVVVGRFSFVYVYWANYRLHWLSIIDLRDGGMLWQWALFGMAIALASVLIKANRAVRKGMSLCAVVALTTWGAGYAYFHLQQEAIKQLPLFTLQRLEVTTPQQSPTAPPSSISLEAYLGKPIVLNLWATWCPPCRREMPVFQSAQQRYPNVHFVLANQKEEMESVVKYLTTQNLQLANLLLDTRGELAEFANSQGLPTTLFIDASGKVQHIRMGELSEASLAHQLTKLMR